MKGLKTLMLAAVAGLALASAAHADTDVAYDQVVFTGVSATYNSTNIYSTTTYAVSNDGRVFLHFKKTGAGAATVTIVTPGTVQGIAITDQTVSIPATTGDKFIGPFPPSIFNDANGKFTYTVSDTVGLSVAVLRL